MPKGSTNHVPTEGTRKIRWIENTILMLNALLLFEAWFRDLPLKSKVLNDLSWKIYDLYQAIGLSTLERWQGRVCIFLLLLLYWILKRKIIRISGGEYRGMIRFLAHILLQKQSFWKKDKTGLLLIALNAYLIWYQFIQIWIALMGV